MPVAWSSTRSGSPSRSSSPYEGGADIVVEGVVKAVDADANRATVELTATSGGDKVLGRALAVVRLD